MQQNPKFKVGDLVKLCGDGPTMKVLDVGVYSLRIQDTPRPCVLCRRDGDILVGGMLVGDCDWHYSDDVDPAEPAKEVTS